MKDYQEVEIVSSHWESQEIHAVRICCFDNYLKYVFVPMLVGVFWYFLLSCYWWYDQTSLS